MARAQNPQLVLDLERPPRYGRDDFLAAPCNRAALDVLERWPSWPDNVLVLRGPAGAGKSHLATIWSDRSGAPIITASDADDRALASLRHARALVIEDADRLPRDEPSLFHLLDAARQSGCFLLLTARTDPTAWAVRLPDLLSRLRLASVVAIDDPDEALVRAVLVKLLADRQLAVELGLIDYAARHLGRSLADSRNFVARADVLSLAASRRITRSIAAEVLKELAVGCDDGE